MPKKREGLIAMRERSGLSQYDVAAALKMPRSTYGQIELGERPLRIELAAKLSRLFNCTIDDLYYGPDGPESKPGDEQFAEVKPSA